ncbi:MAG: hypothetical protein R6U11_10205 [Bacteroidales bacterium]
MKTKFFFLLLLGFFSVSTFGQSSVRSTIYINPAMNIPSYDFGYPKNVPNASLSSVGAGFGLGMLFYFTDEDAELASLVNYGIDFTFAEFALNNNYIIVPENEDEGLFGNYNSELNSRMLSMKVGPVVTIVPMDKFGIDIYAQGMLGMSNFKFYNDELKMIDESPGLSPQYRVAAGTRIGYNIIYLNVEYSWGEPVIRKASGSVEPGHEVSEFKIDQSFLRVGLAIKFAAFK